MKRIGIAVLLALLLAVPAVAMDVQVDCSGADPNAFHSINDALNALDLIGPNSITVRGTCRENVVLAQRDRLTIQAIPGSTAKIQNATDPASITVLITGSHNIVLDHLIITGGTEGLYLTSASGEISVQNCILQNNSGNGVVVEMGSELVVQNSTFRNNVVSGVSVGNQSFVTFGTYPDQQNRITGNGGFGLTVDGAGVQLNFGRLIIDNNQWGGINADNGRLLFFGGGFGGADSPAVIRNNPSGIVLNNSSSATLWGAFRILNNGSVGVRVQGSSSVAFYEVTDSQGRKAVTTISGHSEAGLELWQSSSGQMYGSHLVRNNGSAFADPGSRGGIWIEGASLNIGGGSSVVSNTGPGIRLSMKGDLTIWDATVARNTEEGVRETNLSAGHYANPLTFTGNFGVALYCDKLSVAFGDVASIPNVNCANLSQAEQGSHPMFAIPKR